MLLGSCAPQAGWQDDLGSASGVWCGSWVCGICFVVCSSAQSGAFRRQFVVRLSEGELVVCKMYGLAEAATTIRCIVLIAYRWLCGCCMKSGANGWSGVLCVVLCLGQSGGARSFCFVCVVSAVGV